MNKKLYAIFLLFVINLGCAKKITTPSVPPKAAALRQLKYVPFTKELRDKIYKSNLDIKQVQFFVDQPLIMKRSLGSEKAAVKSGEILFEKGEYVNEVIVPAYTPGVLESVSGDRMRISFEAKNNVIEFAALGDNTLFRLVGSNWNNSDGSADLVYENQIYRVYCGSCPSAGDAKLVIIKKEVDNLQKNKRIVGGRIISK